MALLLNARKKDKIKGKSQKRRECPDKKKSSTSYLWLNEKNRRQSHLNQKNVDIIQR